MELPRYLGHLAPEKLLYSDALPDSKKTPLPPYGSKTTYGKATTTFYLHTKDVSVWSFKDKTFSLIYLADRISNLLKKG